MITDDQLSELLCLVWPEIGTGAHFITDGKNINVRHCGTRDGMRFTGAEAEIDGVVFRGNIIVYNAGILSGENPNDCILHLSSVTESILMKDNGNVIPKALVNLDPVWITAYDALLSDTEHTRCKRYIATLDNFRRLALFTKFETERLQRKCGELMEIYHRCDKNWNETLYVMLMRTMGDKKNKQAFTELGLRVRYGYLSRELYMPEHVEALLLGASGLIYLYDEDDYIRRLKTHFEYLSKKYNITPLNPGQWITYKIHPSNHPVLRLAQLAVFLSTRDFLFDNLIKCRTVEDIQDFFRAEASAYWSDHYLPGSSTTISLPKRIGPIKANLLGINLAVPVLFAYGDYLADETIKERAIDLLEKIGPEGNTILDRWKQYGVVPENAFDTQALLELNNEYCCKEKCAACPVAKALIQELVM